MQIRISWDKNFQCWAIAGFFPTYCYLMDKAKWDFVKVPFGLVTLISTFLFKLKTIPQERILSTGVALYDDWVQEVQENRRCPKTAQFARDYKKKDWQKIQEGISSFLPWSDIGFCIALVAPLFKISQFCKLDDLQFFQFPICNDLDCKNAGIKKLQRDWKGSERRLQRDYSNQKGLKLICCRFIFWVQFVGHSKSDKFCGDRFKFVEISMNS